MTVEINPSNDMKKWLEDSQISGASTAYIDAIYDDYLNDPETVEVSWRLYFDSISAKSKDISHASTRKYFKNFVRSTNIINQTESQNSKSANVLALVESYRSLGHFNSLLDPLKIKKPKKMQELEIGYHNLSKEDLNESFNLGLFADNKELSLNSIVEKLKQTYSNTIGYEFSHVANSNEKKWLIDNIENKNNQCSTEEKKWLLDRLVAAEGLEKILAMKYVGQKRFGLEGGESIIPALNCIINNSADFGAKEIMMGMAHRGRLNVLVNVMGKRATDLFTEFEGKQEKKYLSGDVKYHLGFSSYQKTPNGKEIKVLLAFNPSHLETVDPVVIGSTRAYQDSYKAKEAHKKVLSVLIHGDSAFCGQGVVMETFALSQTRYYNTGGTIHIVVNNQVGFTTNKKEDNRSSYYSTDIAKMVDAPIFHVNGDDPEAVLHIAKLALKYRNEFNKDVVIDIFCYRRNGHNEADEPSGTQPEMYSVIKNHTTTCNLYASYLVKSNIISDDEYKNTVSLYRKKIQDGSLVVDALDKSVILDKGYVAEWKPYVKSEWRKTYDNDVSKKDLLSIANNLTTLPSELKLQQQVQKAISDRIKMNNEDIPCNWGYAENLAYATLLSEGFNVRLTGEDCGRGTFSHRHAVLHNYDFSNESLPDYTPLNNINKNVNCVIADSILSEYGVLGFEYGYSCSSPETLVVWEAQFGDFVNTAQVIIDQFIASAEEKWGILSGLVMLLPHGQEGAGAEHSSARLERFLQLCAHDNMQVCVPTTPSQIYHVLRRQLLRKYRKPLIIMSPKSLLRHPLAVSTIDDLSHGSFENVIDDKEMLDTSKVNRVIFCAGKIYYDLLAKRTESELQNIAIIRVEQLYPLPDIEIQNILNKYKHVSDLVWAQEEPENQGAWWFIHHSLKDILLEGQKLSYAGRDISSVPAVGYPSLFAKQQKEAVASALNILTKP